MPLTFSLLALVVAGPVAAVVLIYFFDRRADRKSGHYVPDGRLRSFCSAAMLGAVILCSLLLKFFVPCRSTDDLQLLFEQLVRTMLCVGVGLVVHRLLLKLLIRA